MAGTVAKAELLGQLIRAITAMISFGQGQRSEMTKGRSLSLPFKALLGSGAIMVTNTMRQK
jgi:hypothetical protein